MSRQGAGPIGCSPHRVEPAADVWSDTPNPLSGLSLLDLAGNDSEHRWFGAPWRVVEDLPVGAGG